MALDYFQSGKYHEALLIFQKLGQDYRLDSRFAAFPGFPGLSDVNGGNVPPAAQNIVDTYIKTGKYVYEMNATMNVASPILSELWEYYVEMTAGMKTPEQVLKAWDVLYTDYMKARKESGF